MNPPVENELQVTQRHPSPGGEGTGMRLEFDGTDKLLMKMQWIMLMLTIALLGTTTAKAQAGKLPPFRMVQSNGVIFKAEDLPLGKPIVIIYFSPDCDHCSELMKELLKRKAGFSKASVAMITYLTVNEVSAFVKRYPLSNWPNMYVGTEGSTYFVKNYYKITTMPFMALYTKNGDLVKTYRTDGSLPDLIKALHQLR